MHFDIRNRYTGDVQFTADIDCAEDASDSVKLGLAVKWAVKSGADLSRADLSHADLSRADLSRADLSHADLSRADLSRADLSHADLYGANLYGADLYGANLYGADLSHADLYGANLSGSVGVISFGPVGAYRRIGYAVKHYAGPMIKLGCFWGTLDEASAKIRAKYGENSAYENLVRAACAALD